MELHIEQGPVLEHLGKDIGIVEGVLGMIFFEISLNGESNHAGTTPYRKVQILIRKFEILNNESINVSAKWEAYHHPVYGY